jgi:hypothetical protein
MDLKKIIVEELKSEGVEIAEDVAIRVLKASLKVAKKVVAESENKVDDLLLPLLGLVEPKLLEALDKIDGHVG